MENYKVFNSNWYVDHIGIACKDIESAVREYQNLGFEKCGAAVEGKTQNIRAQFMQMGDLKIELLEPKDKKNPLSSPLTSYLKTPVYKMYHICYRVKELTTAMQYLQTLRYRKLGEVFTDTSCTSRKLVFMYHRYMGVIELAEESENA